MRFSLLKVEKHWKQHRGLLVAIWERKWHLCVLTSSVTRPAGRWQCLPWWSWNFRDFFYHNSFRLIVGEIDEIFYFYRVFWSLWPYMPSWCARGKKICTNMTRHIGFYLRKIYWLSHDTLSAPFFVKLLFHLQAARYLKHTVLSGRWFATIGNVNAERLYVEN